MRGQAEQLKAAGVDACNHNLNTSVSRYSEICSTHSYEDRVDTVTMAKEAALSAYSGMIVGMGEREEEVIDTLFALRALQSDSVPVDFRMPLDGTLLAGPTLLTPPRCLGILALARFTCPDGEIRMAGGREMHLRAPQAQALRSANSLFFGDYLTSEGQPAKADLEMIADAGFCSLSEHGGLQNAAIDRHPVVAVRRRGAGPELGLNA